MVSSLAPRSLCHLLHAQLGHLVEVAFDFCRGFAHPLLEHCLVLHGMVQCAALLLHETQTHQHEHHWHHQLRHMRGQWACACPLRDEFGDAGHQRQAQQHRHHPHRTHMPALVLVVQVPGGCGHHFQRQHAVPDA